MMIGALTRSSTQNRKEAEYEILCRNRSSHKEQRRMRDRPEGTEARNVYGTERSSKYPEPARGLTLTNIYRDVEGSRTLQIACLTHTPWIYPISSDRIEPNPWSSDSEFAIAAWNIHFFQIQDWAIVYSFPSALPSSTCSGCPVYPLAHFSVFYVVLKHLA